MLAALALASALAGPARAAPDPGFTSLEVELWPEYDKPALLVMMQAELPPEAAVEGVWKASLPMPVEAGTPHAVAFRSDDGKLLLADYTTRKDGETVWVDLVAGSGSLQFEYYAPLDLSKPERAFTWTWPGGPAVGRVGYEVLQPVGATDLVVEPAPTGQQAGAGGETYLTGSLGALAAGQAATVKVRYVKNDATLTREALASAAPAVQAGGGGTPGASTPQLAPPAPATPAPAVTPAPAPAAAPGTPAWVYVVGLLIVAVAGYLLFKPVKKA